jgi:predicted AAA+ superfamily ATPase
MIQRNLKKQIYSDHDYRLTSYRTDAGAEVDFILELNGEIYAIEVKSGHFSKNQLGGFASFEDFIGKKVKKVIVTLQADSRQMGEIEVLPWQKFLKKLSI